MPTVFDELNEMQQLLEDHYDDMQDLEFTIQEGRLWLLQTRTGKRTGASMVRIGMDMLDEGRIDERTLLMRMEAPKMDELLHDVFDKEALTNAVEIGQGLPASPGAATGRLVFFAEDAAEWASRGEEVILARIETSPEDIQGMYAANGILTTRGGMTSHAAVVARGMGKCCVSGAGSIQISYPNRTLTANGVVFHEGDWVSIHGATGQIFQGKVPTLTPDLGGDFGRLMEVADKYARLQVRANADTPEDARVSVEFGAKGIGLCRTEHMFFQEDRILAIREMIIAEDKAGREKALSKLLPMQRQDFEEIFGVMGEAPVTVRLLDPPLHEFLPEEVEKQQEIGCLPRNHT